ncbi:hypothetical protein Mgra_00008443 [Meloidogyne graminicola]|uniref:Uncharacterized protein n=1 Tax=Meloidogyne graminicola TaxID=189291 RepID=A0A8S9ZFQ6_9BILA|nr:hypothetical protein Mgra_00008443 [Meloidogyne graminicola]
MQKFKQENSKKDANWQFSTASEITEEINDEKNKNWKKTMEENYKGNEIPEYRPNQLNNFRLGKHRRVKSSPVTIRDSKEKLLAMNYELGKNLKINLGGEGTKTHKNSPRRSLSLMLNNLKISDSFKKLRKNSSKILTDISSKLKKNKNQVEEQNQTRTLKELIGGNKLWRNKSDNMGISRRFGSLNCSPFSPFKKNSLKLAAKSRFSTEGRLSVGTSTEDLIHYVEENNTEDAFPLNLNWRPKNQKKAKKAVESSSNIRQDSTSEENNDHDQQVDSNRDSSDSESRKERGSGSWNFFFGIVKLEVNLSL